MAIIHAERHRHPASLTTEPPASAARAHQAELSLLLRLIDESYEKKAWHGPNLKGSFRGLAPRDAAWRPQPLRHSIVENVVHCAYWKYAVRRRLTGEKRGSFSLKGSNWFATSSPLSDASWKEFTALLDREHRLLRNTIAEFPPEQLDGFPAGGKVSFVTQIYGIALHDVYHAGQIQLLKRLRQRAGDHQRRPAIELSTPSFHRLTARGKAPRRRRADCGRALDRPFLDEIATSDRGDVRRGGQINRRFRPLLRRHREDVGGRLSSHPTSPPWRKIVVRTNPG